MTLKVKFRSIKFVLITFFFVSISCFNALSQEYYIMVGKIYTPQKCGSTSFSNALAYDFEKLTGKFNYNEIESKLKKRAASVNFVSDSDVKTEGASKQFACIITYEKEHVGWGCKTKQYAVGFGNSEVEAEEHAILKMKNSYKKVSYLVEKRIDARMR